MKSILLTAILVLSSSVSFAQGEYDDYIVTILTWCEDNKVMSDKEDGKVYVYRDCQAHGQTCKAFQIEKMNGTIFAAACQ